MKNKHLVLLFVATMAVGWLLRRAPWRAAQWFQTALIQVDTARLTQLRLLVPGQSELLLERTETGWAALQEGRSVVVPPADMLAMLTALVAIRSVRVVKTKEPDTLGLAESNGLQVTVFQEGQHTEDFWIGRETLENNLPVTFFRLAGHDGNYLVENHLRRIFTRRLEDFRATNICQFSPAAVQTLTVEWPQQNWLVMLRRDSIGQWHNTETDSLRTDSAVQVWLLPLAQLRRQPYADYFDDSRARETLRTRITLGFEPPTPPLTLQLFEIDPADLPENLTELYREKTLPARFVLHSSQNPNNYFACRTPCWPGKFATDWILARCFYPPFAMHIETRRVANWANYPVITAEVAQPEDFVEARDYLLAHDQLLARGNGRCYGDAALSPHLLSTLALNQLIDFDVENGVVHCEAGLLLSDLLRTIIPKGWFLHVTPGIKSITVGGAIASDVHGKNHSTKGCWSNWLISFELLNEKGEILTCSRQENATLFWQTCGGMGWTGVVLTARFQLMRITSTEMHQTTRRVDSFDALFREMADNAVHPYAAAWIDTTDRNGCGAVFFAEHLLEKTKEEPLIFKEKKPLNVPFFAPSWLLNPLSMRAYNELYFWKNKSGQRLVDIDQYFYPLDSLGHWNRLYGRRGFIQYQFCLPEAVAFDGLQRILETIQRSQETPFLSVLKRHGERPPEAVHSFPIRGYSLALDFPRTRTVFGLVNQLDEIVAELGGRIYLAKDACSSARVSGVDPASFGSEKFYSLMKGRLMRESNIQPKNTPNA